MVREKEEQDETFPFAGKSVEETAMLPGAQALTVRLARLVSSRLSFLLLQLNSLRYQGSLVALERQATDLMQEIKATHTRWGLNLDPTQANSC